SKDQSAGGWRDLSNLGFLQGLVDPALPAFAGRFKLGDHIGVEPDRYLLKRLLDRRTPTRSLDALGQIRKGLSEGLPLGDLLIGEFRTVNGIPIFLGVAAARLELLLDCLADHSICLLSFWLAGRIDMTEIPSEPSRAKITAMLPSARRPIAIQR